MNPVLVWVLAIAITLFHIWASRRKPKYWYLGGIVPALWAGALVFLFANGKIDLGADWRILVFPTAVLLLVWLEGHEAAKKKEIERMKAKDLM